LSERVSEPIPLKKPGRLAGADFITAIFFIVMGAGMIISSLGMKTRAAYTILISPGFFPMILGGLFILFGIFQAYVSSLRGGYADARRIFSGGNLKRSFTSPVFKKGGMVFLLIFTYVGLMGKIDFIPLSMGYLLLTFFFLKAGKWYWLAAIAFSAPFIVHLVFNYVFRIPMP
jgi:hypothetical protein